MSADIEVSLLHRGDLYRGMAEPVTWELIGGLTARIDGEIAGYAGLHRFGQHHWVFFNTFDDRVKRPFFLHRLVASVIAAYDTLGIMPIYSLAGQPGIEIAAAERWHRVLGFRPVTDEERDDEIRLAETINSRGAWVR